MKHERIKGNLDALLLGVLERGPAHGYEIITALARRSGGEFELPEGTVYPSLHALERDGLLTSSWSSDGGRRRRVYALTDDGHAALARERSEWGRFATGMNLILGRV